MRVGAGAEEGDIALGVLGGALAKELHDLAFGVLARDIEVAGEPVLGRNGGEEIVDGIGSDLGEHGVAVRLRLRKIAHGYLCFLGDSN